jgi:hypothetical protein
MNFDTWYKKFLAEPIGKEEKVYLKLFKKDSKEGKTYVKIQKEQLERAWIAGYHSCTEDNI